MRTLTALVLVALLALPAAAAECSELEISQGNLSPLITEHAPGEGVWTSIVGHFLWVHYGDAPEAGHEGDDAVTVDVSDPAITGATVCPDGTVTLHSAEAAENDESEAVALPEIVDLGKVYADFQPLIDSLLRLRPF